MFDFGFGDRRGMVTVWQRFLEGQGIDIGASGADGVFGNDSRTGTELFQGQVGLPVTGWVNAETWTAAMATSDPPLIPSNFSNALIDWYRILKLMRDSTLWGSYDARRQHWIDMYDKMLEAFDDAQDRETAIRRMRAYYGDTDLHSIGESVGLPRNGASRVHPELKARIVRAVTLVQDKTDVGAALGTVQSQGGFSIRRITSGTSLSNHSFATAIDLSASRNPFVLKGNVDDKGTDFPVEEFVFLTNVDPFSTEMIDLLSTSREKSFDDVFPEIEKQCQASDDFVAAFRDQDTLAEAFRRAVDRQGWPAITQSEALRLLGFGSATSAGNAETRRMGRILRDLFDRKEVAADSQNSTRDPGYIARFGWVNLDPTLITALMCVTGGGLRWIGAGRTRKDAMHFEIYLDEALRLRRPPLLS